MLLEVLLVVLLSVITTIVVSMLIPFIAPRALGVTPDSTVFTKVAGRDTGAKHVVFIPGLGDSHVFYNWNEQSEDIIKESGWKRNSGVQDPVSRITKTLSFDMPGVGASADMEPLGSFAATCRMLHRMVRRHDIKTPFILVGHSIGGATARVYADMYPNDVCGLVLIDPTPEFVIDEMSREGFYAKVGQRKYEVTRSYISAYVASRREIPRSPPLQPTHVHYNVDESDIQHVRKALFEKSIREFYSTDNCTVIRHVNLTHFIHVVDPLSILTSIYELVGSFGVLPYKKRSNY